MKIPPPTPFDMTDSELESYLADVGVTEEGMRLIRLAVQQAPCRHVESKGGNVLEHFRSEKMNRVIDCESRTLEGAHTLRLEYDPGVLGFFPQPFALDIQGETDKRGRPFPSTTVPDFLVFTNNETEVHECKPDKRLETLSQRHPGRFCKDEDGRWHRPAIERQLARYGIRSRIITSQDINYKFITNLRFLRDYIGYGTPELNEERAEAIRHSLAGSPFKYVEELIREGLATADEIYKAIARGVVYFDLNNDLLHEKNRARVYPNESLATFFRNQSTPSEWYSVRTTSVILAEGAEIIVGNDWRKVTAAIGESFILEDKEGTQTHLDRKVVLKLLQDKKIQILKEGSREKAANQKTHDLLIHLSPEQIEIGILRWKVLCGEEVPELQRCDRSVREWKRRVQGVDPNDRLALLSALAPQTHKRGTRGSRLSTLVQSHIAEILKTKYFAPENLSSKRCYALLCKALQEHGLDAPSYQTFLKRLKDASDRWAIYKRSGKRVAYAHKPHTIYLDYREPVHGTRPFEVVHIDHTPLDIGLLSPAMSQILGRPWLTLAIDACTRAILGFYLTFDPPSRVSLFMVLRDIVRRHRRLMNILVLDNGREFQSADCRRFAEIFDITLRFRPAAQSRFGAPVERMFGKTNQEFLHDLHGNTKIMRHVRSVTKSVSPTNFAEWTIEHLYAALEYYFFHEYANAIHSTLKQSPAKMLEDGMRYAGARSNRLVQANEEFAILTCPSVDRGGVRNIHQSRGIKILNEYYLAPELSQPKLYGQTVPVKFDPWDIRHCYAYVEGKWVECFSKHYSELDGISFDELRARTATLTAEAKAVGRSLSPEEIAERMAVSTPEDFDNHLHEKKQATRKLYEDDENDSSSTTLSDTSDDSYSFPTTSNSDHPALSPFPGEDENDDDDDDDDDFYEPYDD